MYNFDGKTALISGGAEGIGLSIAHALGKRGMQIVLGDIDAAQLAKAQSASPLLAHIRDEEIIGFI